MLRRHLAVLGNMLGLLALLVAPAWANRIDKAAVTASCTNYTIEVRASHLRHGVNYTIDYKIKLTPSSGKPVIIKGQIGPFQGDSNGDYHDKATEPLGPYSNGQFKLSGTATLVGHNTIPIKFHPRDLTCNACSALGKAANYAVLGLQGATINLSSGPLRIYGNAGIGQDGIFNFSGGGAIEGELDADPSAQVNISGGGTTITGGIHQISMLPVENAALAEASAVGSLTPTQTFNSITSSQTINGDGSLNVVLINDNIHLSGGNNLTISGGSSDTFIFQVTQGLQLDGGSNIVLQGVLPSQVLFYFPSSGDQVQTSGQAQTAGIFLAPGRTIQINGGIHYSEFISGETLSFQSNPVVHQACQK